MEVKQKEVNAMAQDKFSTMLRDGNDYLQIIQRVPENKRFLLAIIADAFLSGMDTQEAINRTADNAAGQAERR